MTVLVHGSDVFFLFSVARLTGLSANMLDAGPLPLNWLEMARIVSFLLPIQEKIACATV